MNIQSIEKLENINTELQSLISSTYSKIKDIDPDLLFSFIQGKKSNNIKQGLENILKISYLKNNIESSKHFKNIDKQEWLKALNMDIEKYLKGEIDMQTLQDIHKTMNKAFKKCDKSGKLVFNSIFLKILPAMKKIPSEILGNRYSNFCEESFFQMEFKDRKKLRSILHKEINKNFKQFLLKNNLPKDLYDFVLKDENGKLRPMEDKNSILGKANLIKKIYELNKVKNKQILNIKDQFIQYQKLGQYDKMINFYNYQKEEKYDLNKIKLDLCKKDINLDKLNCVDNVNFDSNFLSFQNVAEKNLREIKLLNNKTEILKTKNDLNELLNTYLILQNKYKQDQSKEIEDIKSKIKKEDYIKNINNRYSTIQEDNLDDLNQLIYSVDFAISNFILNEKEQLQLDDIKNDIEEKINKQNLKIELENYILKSWENLLNKNLQFKIEIYKNMTKLSKDSFVLNKMDKTESKDMYIKQEETKEIKNGDNIGSNAKFRKTDNNIIKNNILYIDYEEKNLEDKLNMLQKYNKDFYNGEKMIQLQSDKENNIINLDNYRDKLQYDLDVQHNQLLENIFMPEKFKKYFSINEIKQIINNQYLVFKNKNLKIA